MNFDSNSKPRQAAKLFSKRDQVLLTTILNLFRTCPTIENHLRLQAWFVSCPVLIGWAMIGWAMIGWSVIESSPNQSLAQSMAEPLAEIRSSRLRDLDTHCPAVAPSTLAAWETRSSELKMQLKVALGLHPMPRLAEQPIVIRGLRRLEGYSIEQVYFESLPGFFVTGSLYRPLKTSSDRYPLVLLPHGHWKDGRFYNAPPKEVLQLLASGAERFENAAINHMQAQCVQLARMGIVVFQYDMIGYADSLQISLERAHEFGIRDSDVLTTEDGWPFFSPTAEGYLQSIMGLQTLNTIQAINLIGSLPDIDPDRIAITGASGGGTQSFIAMALDQRLSGAFPAVMVSTGMQGGCTCENASCLRIDTGNVEIAALAAPRSLGITAADDWTRTIKEDGYPTLQAIYSLYGKSDRVSLFSATQFPHNYNHLSRTAMYGWANKLFGLGLSEPILESDFQLLNRSELTVWDVDHPAPSGGPIFERKLLKAWAEQVDLALKIESPSSKQKDGHEQSNAIIEGWKTLLQPAVRLAKKLSIAEQIRIDRNEKDIVVKNEEGTIVGRLVSIEKGNRQAFDPSQPISLVLGSTTTDSKATDDSKTQSNSGIGLKNAWQLIICDPVTSDLTLLSEQPLVDNPRPAANYTYGYNAPQLVRKLAVVLAINQAMDQVYSTPLDQPRRLLIDADAEKSFLAWGAKLMSEKPIEVVSTPSISTPPSGSDDSSIFRKVESIRSPNFVPGGLRYQDLRGLTQLPQNLRTDQ